MKPLRTFFVEPSLPERLSILKELAYNLRWTWDADTRALFQRIDQDSWDVSGGNPVRMLGSVPSSRFSILEADDSFLYHLDQVKESYREYREGESTWFRRTHPEISGVVAAYFSAEFGLTDCLPIFSGGLGILAGDHIKSASDMGIPLVGVGLLYQQGYFHQYLNHEGWQQETYPTNDFYTMPLDRVRNGGGDQMTLDIPFPGRTVKTLVWAARVGRNTLFLLDTNHPANQPNDRAITSQLYGGNQETRIQQEIILGMGGVRVLKQLHIAPPILHTNEGHAAFLALERIRQLVKEEGMTFAQAVEGTRSSVIFTTHTPVPAGIDVFPSQLVRTYFSDYCRDVGIGVEQLLALGKIGQGNHEDGFNMAVLAVHLSYGVNAVSKLHRTTSRLMWQNLWPGVPLAEIPIGSVTNGIHVPSWISNEMGMLLDRYLGPRWREDARDRVNWDRVDKIPSEELWRTHERRRERLVAFARKSVREQLVRQGESPMSLRQATEVLDPEALTIGFARRFAPYKRAHMLFRDMDRLVKLLSDRKRPVQILYAGKAHPQDQFGKEIIREIVASARRHNLSGRIVFLENYNINTARYLVQGVDVWLNNPRRPKEASGTSGMKAVANGVLHLSTKDGWWAEVNSEGLGWTIGGGEEYSEDQEPYQDEVEARALYDLLENEIVPLFYDRTESGIPHGWVQMMKRSMKTLCPVFNTNRMVRQYAERYYLPARSRHLAFKEDQWASLKDYSAWVQRVRSQWSGIRLKGFDADLRHEMPVGSSGAVSAKLQLEGLNPEDILVEVVYGRIDSDSLIEQAGSIPMQFKTRDDAGLCQFDGVVPCVRSGKFGFALRVLPAHKDIPNAFQTGLIRVFDQID